MPPKTLRVLADVLALRAGLWFGQQVTVAAFGASRGEWCLGEGKIRQEDASGQTLGHYAAEADRAGVQIKRGHGLQY